MSVHHFDTRIAEKVGIPAAVIAYAIRYWCDHKAANEKDIHDGKAWVYNSVKAWSELLPYMSEKQIRTAIKKLEDAGIIESRNLNPKQYDQTLWYCYNGLQTVINIANCPNGQMQLPKKENAFAQTGESNCPKGQTNTNNIPNNIPNEINGEKALDEIWPHWSSVGRKRSESKTKLIARLNRMAKTHDIDQIVRACRMYARATDSNYHAGLNVVLKTGQWENWIGENKSPEQTISLDDWKAAAVRYCELQIWNRDQFGPAPHEPGCVAPAGLLRTIATKMQAHRWHARIEKNLNMKDVA